MFDLPGHVDFGEEVSRSLHFVQGAVLLLDAAQGIQAQTWSAYDKARNMNNPPKLLVALTKVDLDTARPIHVALTVSEWLQWDDPDSILLTSARDRRGVKDVLDAVCEQVPPPSALADDNGDEKGLMRAVVVDSWYETGGVRCLVQVVSGTIHEGDRISLLQAPNMPSKQSSIPSFLVQQVGMVLPKLYPTKLLRRGQMGLIQFGLKDPRQAIPGTVVVLSQHASQKLLLPENLPDVSTGRSVLYTSVHPEEADGFEDLCNAVERLALNDTGLEVHKTMSTGSSSEGGGPFLGPGLRVGFQGLLHVEVFRQRLFDEFGIEAVVKPPIVPYTITFFPTKREPNLEQYTKVVEDLAEWPEHGRKYQVLEPIVDARIIARGMEDTGPVLDLLTRKRATNIQTQPLDEEKWLYTARIPWMEVVTDMHDQLKTVTAGYGSLDTSTAIGDNLAEADLHKVEIMLNGQVVEPLSFVCHRDVMHAEGKSVCKKVSYTTVTGLTFTIFFTTSLNIIALCCVAPRSSSSSAVCYGHSGKSCWSNYFKRAN